MSQVTGADVAQLRDLANVMDSEAGRLSALRNRIAGRLLTTAWSGPDAARFKVEWVKHVVGLTGAAMTLSGCAQRLRKEADEQEDASSAKGDHSARTTGARSPSSTPALLAAGDAAGSDGVRIQKVLGSDGKERYIVYIGGTGAGGNPTDGKNFFDAGENINAAAGLDSQTSLMIKQKMEEAGINSESDVMFVGYSQGGLYAQTLARDGTFGKPPIVITRGAPEVLGSMRSVDILRLEVAGDSVVSSLNPNARYNDASRVIFGDAGSGTDYTSTYGYAPPVLDPVTAFVGGVAVHVTPATYQLAATAFDGDNSQQAVHLRSRMDDFHGQIISDTDEPARRV